MSFSPRQRERFKKTLLSVADQHLPKRYFAVDGELVQEGQQWIVRLYVEGQGFRISLDECAEVSRALDPHIESLAELNGYSYQLEVSSPGLFRSLSTERDAQFYTGWPVKLSPNDAELGTETAETPTAEASEEGYLKSVDWAAQTFTLERADASVLEAPWEQWQIRLNPSIDWNALKTSPSEDAGEAEPDTTTLSPENN